MPSRNQQNISMDVARSARRVGASKSANADPTGAQSSVAPKTKKPPPSLASLTPPARWMLALDASSTTIGWSLWDVTTHRGQMVDGGTLVLKDKDICQRLVAGEMAVDALCARLRGDNRPPDVLTIERAAWGGNKAYNSRDEQNQMMGIIRKVLYQSFGIVNARTIRVSANTGKKQLTGYGHADKDQMLLFAQAHVREADEHCADSVGIALGALAAFDL